MEALVQSLLQAGAIGAVLAWILYKIEPRLRQVELAVERLVRSQMLFVLANTHEDSQIHQQAQDILRDLGAPEHG